MRRVEDATTVEETTQFMILRVSLHYRELDECTMQTHILSAVQILQRLLHGIAARAVGAGR